MILIEPDNVNIPRSTPVPDLWLRTVTAADRGFLYRLYASTREAELAQVDWSDEDKERFLRMQFDAQDRHYRQHYPGAELDLILRGETAVGRLYVHRQPHDIRIMDIALSPEARGQGLGSALLRALMAELAEGQRLSIHVEKFNPALALYRRLGFVETEDKGVYLLMSYRLA